MDGNTNTGSSPKPQSKPENGLKSVLVALFGLLTPLATVVAGADGDAVVVIGSIIATSLVAITALVGLSGVDWLLVSRGLRAVADMLEDLENDSID